MKHGDKAKGKASKASGKKSGAKVHSGKSVKAEAAKSKKQSGGSAPAKAAAGKTASSKEGGNGKVRPREAASDGGGEVRFTNSRVGDAFKRAVKKYPNAFRRLTD